MSWFNLWHFHVPQSESILETILFWITLKHLRTYWTENDFRRYVHKDWDWNACIKPEGKSTSKVTTLSKVSYLQCITARYRMRNFGTGGAGEVHFCTQLSPFLLEWSRWTFRDSVLGLYHKFVTSNKLWQAASWAERDICYYVFLHESTVFS
jgi:hypothetical protein